MTKVLPLRYLALALVGLLCEYGIFVRITSAAEVIMSPVQIERSVIERTRSGVGQVITEDSRGSGFFLRIRDRIFFLTNRHVVESALVQESSNRTRQTKAIRVKTPDGTVIRASVWRSSRNHDIAILRLEAVPPATLPLELSSELPPAGAGVFLWGAPYGEALVPLDGMVESIDHNGDPGLFAGTPVRVINVRISVGPGNSGGPLLSRAGKVIGVVTARQESPGRISGGYATAVATGVFYQAVLSLDPTDSSEREQPQLRRAEPQTPAPAAPPTHAGFTCPDGTPGKLVMQETLANGTVVRRWFCR